MKKQPDPLLYPLSITGGIISASLFRYFPLLVLLILGIGFFSARKNIKRLPLIAGLFAFGFLYCFFRVTQPVSPEKSLHGLLSSNRSAVYVEAVTFDLPIKTRYGYMQKVKLLKPSIGVNSCYLSLQNPLGPNHRVWGWMHLVRNTRGVSPGTKAMDSLMLQPVSVYSMPYKKGIRGISDGLRWRLYRKLDELFSEEVSAFLKAILIGHRDSTVSPLYRNFSSTGLAHLMSISGTHFGLLALIVFVFTKAIARLLPYRILVRATRYMSLQEYAAVLTIPFVLFYLMLSGARVPALRSFIMMMLFLLGLLSGRINGWRYGIVAAASVILIADPESIFTPSFLLSFSAVWFIGSAYDFMQIGKSGSRSKDRLNLYKLIITPFSALAGTIGLTLYFFHKTSVLALPMNMVVTPVVGFLLLPVALISAVVFVVIGVFPFAGLLGTLVSWVLKAVGYVSSFKDMVLNIRAIPLGVIICWYLFLMFLTLRKRLGMVFSFFMLIVAGVISFVLYQYRTPMVTFLDVGQADSAVVETASGRTIVIDTGRRGIVTEAYLSYMGKDEIDAIVVTHGGKDHSGGIYRLLRDFYVKEVWDNGEMIYNPPLKNIKLRHLRTLDVLSSGKAEFMILHPYSGYFSRWGAADNNRSLVIKYTEKPLTVLFTGDIEADAEQVLLRFMGRLKSKVLKVPHHGSRTSTTEDFLRLVSPEIAVISVGRFNPYAHPHKEVLERLRETKLLRTDIDSAVRIYTDSSGDVRVSKYRDLLFEDLLEGYTLGREVNNLKRLFLVW